MHGRTPVLGLGVAIKEVGVAGGSRRGLHAVAAHLLAIREQVGDVLTVRGVLEVVQGSAMLARAALTTRRGLVLGHDLIARAISSASSSNRASPLTEA